MGVSVAQACACAVVALGLMARQRRARARRALDRVELEVKGMMCQRNCGATVERALGKVPGVEEVEVVAKEHAATLLVDKGTASQEICAAVEAVGFDAKLRARESLVQEKRHGAVGPPTRTLKLRVKDMMCQKNCGSTVERTLRKVPGVVEATARAAEKIAEVKVEADVDPEVLVAALGQIGFEAKVLDTKALFVRKKKRPQGQLRHTCLRDVVEKDELVAAFEGVKKHYHEQQLVEYSRYKNWTQSCYMECHDHWSPQVPVDEALFHSMLPVLDKCRARFGEWYKDLYGLDEVEVVTLNSFITKYIPVEGKSEFGKHVDSAKIDGSLILALPTENPHDWPGLLVWDGPKDTQGETPEHLIKLNPGDVCCLDSLVWHHGLPITQGERYVAVCFYKCKWKKIKS